MIIYPGLFVPGLFLLLFPADRLLSRFVELRSFESFRSLEDSPGHRPWWWVPLLWIDPLRAFAGTICLKTSLVAPAYGWVETEKAPYFAMVGALCLAVACQMYNRRDGDSLLAPIGFVAGMAAALAPWTVAGVGVVVALMGMFAFRSFHSFFGMGLLIVAFFGVVLERSTPWLIPSMVIFAVPVGVGFFSGRSLDLPARRSGAQPLITPK